MIKHFRMITLTSGFLLSVVIAAGFAGPPDTAPYRLSPLFPGGDVLRPEQPSSSHWYIGLDAGLTYSSFMNGPVSIYLENPYHPNDLGKSIPATIDEGSGLGYYVGGTLDYGFSDRFGIALKVNYHTRMGQFEQTTNDSLVHPATQTGLTSIFSDKVDWEFQYVGVDLLARIQIVENSVYVLVGPSMGFLTGNSAKDEQRIVRPDDIYYTEAVFVNNETERMLRTATTSEQEVVGIQSTRFDLKAGVGTWIPLTKKLSLVPEIMFAYPITQLLEEDYAKGTRPATATPDKSAVFVRPTPNGFIRNDEDFNMLTFFFTIGLRWEL